MFSPKLIKSDVTAVKLLSNHVVAGIGASLFVYGRTTNRLIQESKVFDGHKIHGIVPNDENSQLLIYGGNNCRIVTFDLQPLQSVISHSWILAAKWLSNGTIALVHMTNKLSIFDQNLVELKQSSCQVKCNLYSACICNSNETDLIVLSGTVFSEILIWKPASNQVLTRLTGHNGVIFSISYNNGLICSGSDDRSSILWSLGDDFGARRQPEVKCRVYGHQSRVFSCKVLNNFFITGGEDSIINLWSFEGVLIRKIQAHQQSPVWCLDCDGSFIVSGGGDGGLTTFPIDGKLSEYQLAIPDEVPRRIGILQKHLVAITESGTLFCYSQNKWGKIERHRDLKHYVVMEISDCRNLVSLSGYEGQIYIYRLLNDGLELVVSKVGPGSRIFSFHWLSCNTFFTCGAEGKLSLWLLRKNTVSLVTNFILPPSKERWTTAACQTKNGLYIIGDRRGNLHVYKLESPQPIQTLKRAHNYLGVTQIITHKNKIMSLGRNAVLNTFSLNSNNFLTRVSSDKLPFTWLASLVQDVIVAFSGNNFIVWNCEKRRICLKINCGGGHRSWDFFDDKGEVFFVYLKDKMVNVVEGASISSTDLVSGFHNSEINSMKVIKVGGKFLVLSGGEDTSLRISLMHEKEFVTLNSFKAHLSSVRTICVCKISNDYLVFSGGGRAQIICWKLQVEKDDADLIEQHSYYKEISNEEVEVRIMDLVAVAAAKRLQLFAACSDGNIKVFNISCINGKYELIFFTELFYKLRCIIKLCVVNVANCSILVSMATDGNLVFWNISNSSLKIQPLKSISCHQSGINSYGFKVLNDHVAFATGGDDNAIVVTYLKIEAVDGNIEILEEAKFSDFGTHCAQITGIYICDNYFLTTSIDQRLAIFKWSLIDHKFVCELLHKYNSAIADIQGMECLHENDVLRVLLYGKGVEYLEIKIL